MLAGLAGHEIGIRIAVGASQNRVRKLILRQSLILTWAGVTPGLVGAFVLTRFFGALESSFHGDAAV
jgi:ABC-type antimicrobial peptide transport system permease subunit